jgi:hypothetical protein
MPLWSSRYTKYSYFISRLTSMWPLLKVIFNIDFLNRSTLTGITCQLRHHHILSCTLCDHTLWSTESGT